MKQRAIYTATPDTRGPGHKRDRASLFNYLSSVAGQAYFVRRFSREILAKKRTHGQCVLIFREENIRVFFWAKHFELGVVIMNNNGKETFIEL